MTAQPFEARLAHLDGVVVQIRERLNGTDRCLDSVDSRICRFEERVDARFSIVDQRFSAIDHRFNWLIGIVVGSGSQRS